MSRPAEQGRRRGFTLLEAAAALAVLGLTAATALAALSADLRGAFRVRHAIVAEALASERLATLRLAEPTSSGRLPDSLRRGDFAPPFEDYQWRASREPARGADDLVLLRVEVEWPAGSYALATYALAPAGPPTRMPARRAP